MTSDSLDGLRVDDAVAAHYKRHGLPDDGGATAAFFNVRVGPLVVPLPNPPSRKRAVYFHDVNHVVTGYNTVFSDGEMVIAGYELGSGCGPYAIAWFINFWMFAFGLVMTPRALFRAFVRGRRAKSVYVGHDQDGLRVMRVGELRLALSIPVEAPPAGFADIAVFAAWSIAAVIATLGPVALIAVWMRRT